MSLVHMLDLLTAGAVRFRSGKSVRRQPPIDPRLPIIIYRFPATSQFRTMPRWQRKSYAADKVAGLPLCWQIGLQRGSSGSIQARTEARRQ